MRDTLGFVDHADIEGVANGSSALSWTLVQCCKDFRYIKIFNQKSSNFFI